MNRLGIAAFGIVALVSLTLIARPREATPQPSKKVPTIGVLNAGMPDLGFSSIAALRQGLRALGYVEGQTIELEYRWAQGKVETLPGLAAELVRRNVDILYTSGPQAIRAAIGASRTIPIVADDLEDDPVESGFVASLAKPGGNVTGLFLNMPDLAGKWVQLIKEVVPTARRVAVLWDATTTGNQLPAVTAAAQGAAIDVRVLAVRRPSEYADALRTALKDRPQALIQLSSPLIRQTAPTIADFTVKNRLPSISMFRFFAESGGLMSYGPDLTIFFARNAGYVDRILKGAKPGDLPVEQPTKFELVINLKAAKAMGLRVPPSVLGRADAILE